MHKGSCRSSIASTVITPLSSFMCTRCICHAKLWLYWMQPASRSNKVTCVVCPNLPGSLPSSYPYILIFEAMLCSIHPLAFLLFQAQNPNAFFSLLLSSQPPGP